MRFAALVTLSILVTGEAHAQKFERVANEGVWQTECRTDAMNDRRECRVRTEINQIQPAPIASSLYIETGQFQVIGYPYPAIVRIRVDGGKEISKVCRVICSFDPKENNELMKQFTKGRSFLITLTTVNGEVIEPRKIDLAGLNAALAAAK